MKNLNFWIKKLDPYFEELDEIPLFRGESISLKDLSDSIKKDLQISHLSIFINTIGWKKQEEIQEMLGNNLNQLCLTLTPLMGNVYILMNPSDITALTSSFLSINSKNNFSSIVLEEGFYRFLTLYSLNHLKKTTSFQGLSPKIVEGAEIKSTEAYCLDINIEINKTIIHAFLAITSDFRKSWNEFFITKKSILFDKIKQNVEVPIQITAGEVFLKKNEWDAVQEGDFIILDRSYLTKDENKVILTLNDAPIFHAKIVNNNIQILDYATYYEENEYMEQKFNKNIDLSKEADENISEQNKGFSKENIASKEGSFINEDISPLKDVPVKITVELAKLSIPLEKLMELQPGNLLKLPISPDNPINLTVHGKKIGTAELTQIGEIYGIRILQIG